MKTPFILNKRQRELLEENAYHVSTRGEAKNIREGRDIQNTIELVAERYREMPRDTTVHIVVDTYDFTLDVCGNSIASYSARIVLESAQYLFSVSIVDNGSRRQQVGYGDTNESAEYALVKLGYNIAAESHYTRRSERESIYKLKDISTLGDLFDAADGVTYYKADVEGVEVKAPFFYAIERKIKTFVIRCTMPVEAVTIQRISGSKVSNIIKKHY